MMASFVVTYMVFCPTVLEVAFTVLNCSDIINDGLRLQSDMHVKCWQGQHATYSVLLAIPTIVIWLYVAPFCFYYLLKKNEAIVNQLKAKEVTRFEKD